MARSSITDQIFLNDGLGNSLPIQTGTWQSKAINMSEGRRLSVTLGMQGSTGIAGGGFTGTLFVQGTDEVGNAYGSTGTVAAGAGSQPGQNSQTGALWWNTIPSGAYNINNNTTSALLTFTDVGTAWIRFVFNPNVATAIGSGTMQVFISRKNT